MRNKEAIFSLLRESAESTRESEIVEELINKIERRMPPIEIIDDIHRRCNGMIYRKSTANGRYAIGQQLSRAVWTYFNGEIPTGCEIHHIDEDKINDDIDNLQLLTKSEHWKLHGKAFGAVKTTKTTKFVCLNCGDEFEAVNTGNNKFCSAKCKNHYQTCVAYQATVRCKICGNEFTAYKYNKGRQQKFCSHRCADEYVKLQSRLTAICEYCGKEFTVYKHDAERRRFCS